MSTLAHIFKATEMFPFSAKKQTYNHPLPKVGCGGEKFENQGITTFATNRPCYNIAWQIPPLTPVGTAATSTHHNSPEFKDSRWSQSNGKQETFTMVYILWWYKCTEYKNEIITKLQYDNAPKHWDTDTLTLLLWHLFLQIVLLLKSARQENLGNLQNISLQCFTHGWQRLFMKKLAHKWISLQFDGNLIN